MKTVIKLGGSLAKNKNNLLAMCKMIADLGSHHQLLIVPGGGHYADLVREDDALYHISSPISHRMAIHGMSQYGYLLHHLIPNSKVIHLLTNFKNDTLNGISIWLPHHELLSGNCLPNTWEITSDSISAYAANYLHLDLLILLKSVDGVCSQDPLSNNNCQLIPHVKAHELTKYGVVDPLFCNYLVSLRCWILNGNHPLRLQQLLLTGYTYGTEIS